MRAFAVLLAALAAIAVTSAAPNQNAGRIVGGSVTNITEYPFASSLLWSFDLVNYWQSCGGSILNIRTILSAAHCFFGDTAVRWRIRIGSTFANSGGTVHNTALIINHPNYNPTTLDNDIALLHSLTAFVYIDNFVQPGLIAGTTYDVPANQVVWAIGWGWINDDGPVSQELRHVQVWTIHQAACRDRYAELGWAITDNMLCSGWLDIGGRDQCTQDSGGPLLHENVIVGVCSSGYSCAHPRYPGINTRINQFTNWIVENA